MSQLRVHHLETSRSTRVLWLLAELEVEFELVVHQRNANFRAPAELRELHPLGKAPLVEHEGRVLAESGAILEYLVDRFDPKGRLRPNPDSEAFFQHRYWMHYAEGSLMAPLLVRLITDRVASAPMPFFIKPIAKGIVDKVDQNFTAGEVERHAAFLESHLAQNEWFCGDTFSVADIQMVYGVEGLVTRGRVEAPTRELERWRKACRARPAFARALEQGGPLIPED